jgi:plasmid replication initiation protein
MKLYPDLLKELQKKEFRLIAEYPTQSKTMIKRYESWLDKDNNQYIVEVMVNDASIVYQEITL